MCGNSLVTIARLPDLEYPVNTFNLFVHPASSITLSRYQIGPNKLPEGRFAKLLPQGHNFVIPDTLGHETDGEMSNKALWFRLSIYLFAFPVDGFRFGVYSC
jgi:hypothetical protein